ncbi:MAG: hypothetical protein ABIN44_04400 [Burkholderiaceae bacterium]
MLLAASVLPAAANLPPLSDGAKAKAAESAAKAAWSAKVAAFHLCEVTNRVVENYHASMKKDGKDTAPQVEAVTNCANPGPFTPVAPLETAGAHSPPATAIAPPSTQATEAELKGGVKK